MSRKKSMQGILSRYDTESEKLNRQEKSIRESKDIPYREKESQLNSIKGQRVTLANLLHYDGMNVVEEARLALNAKVMQRPANYHTDLANALAIVKVAGKNLTPGEVHALVAPFPNDPIAHIAFVSAFAESGNTFAGYLIPASDTGATTKKLDALERFFKNNVAKSGDEFDVINQYAASADMHNLILGELDDSLTAVVAE